MEKNLQPKNLHLLQDGEVQLVILVNWHIYANLGYDKYLFFIKSITNYFFRQLTIFIGKLNYFRFIYLRLVKEYYEFIESVNELS